jgi:LPXTG-site transpeptidase (sortase) family protein
LVGRLEIPRVGLSVVVLDGDDERTLLLGAGRVPGTSRAGGTGNLVISGHRDTFFRPLREVRKGDQIRVTTLDGVYPYVVKWTSVVDPSDTGVLADTPEPSLTLVTCYPFQFVGPAPQRFVVRARLAAGDQSQDPGEPLPDVRPSLILARQRPPDAAARTVPVVDRTAGPDESKEAAPAETRPAPPIDRPAAARSRRGVRALNPGRLFKKLARAVRHPRTESGESGEQSNAIQ